MSNYLKYSWGYNQSARRSKRETITGVILVLAGAALMTLLAGSVNYSDLETCRLTGICWGV